MAALAVLEDVGRVPGGHKLSQDPSLRSIVRSMQEERQREAPPKKRASMYTAAVVIGLELLVVSDVQPSYSRPGFTFAVWILL